MYIAISKFDEVYKQGCTSRNITKNTDIETVTFFTSAVFGYSCIRDITSTQQHLATLYTKNLRFGAGPKPLTSRINLNLDDRLGKKRIQIICVYSSLLGGHQHVSRANPSSARGLSLNASSVMWRIIFAHSPPRVIFLLTSE